MAQSVFGVGFLFATPSGANPTPTRFGRLQDVGVDFSYDNKLLYGSNQYALEQARGKAKIELKAAVGVVDPILFNNIFFGLTTTTGETLNSVDESATPSTGTFTVANGATFSQDLGVYNTVTGLWMTRVASAPAAGQYAVNTVTGVYTTNTAQNGQLLKASYTYASASSGSSLAFTNQLMGASVTFSVQLVNKFKGSDGVVRSLYLNFPAVQCPKLSMPLKLDDFTLPQLDMSAQDNGAGAIFNYSMTG
ncbi:MAG TPA: hypothetical protein VN694_14420 [Caulobacteraceae bacterium]|nr:hypothetical protein [Caulobacteraceae bacterium]